MSARGYNKRPIPILIIWILFSIAGAGRAWAGIWFSSPVNGSTVSGTITVTLNPDSGTAWSDWYLDGVYQRSTPPTSFSWNTSGSPNGTHHLTATAFNSSGGTLGSASTTVTVANSVPSGAVSFVAPSDGSTVSGTVSVTVSNAGSTSWSNVYIDGIYVNSTPPTSVSWNTGAVSNGAHQISATAFNSSGNNLGTSIVHVTVANGSGGGSSAVTITSPSAGSTVSGTVSIAYTEGSGTAWVNTYVDGNYLASSPPKSVSWSSSSVTNGSHTISAKAFNSSGSQVGTSSVAVTVSNSSGTGHFLTLPPGSPLPSGATCAAEVRRTGFEPRPGNYTANHTVPSDLSVMHSSSLTGGAPSSSFTRVDGNFTGTTDEILQWGACKWGFDEDLVRANAVEESGWQQTPGAGDITYNTSLCPPGATYSGGGCYLTYGVLQVKSIDFGGTFPYSQQSTAFGVDYKLAYQRACYEGKIGYLSSRSSDYPSGSSYDMLWGCVDQWLTGTWWNGSDDWYISDVKKFMSTKPWLSPGF
jgi:Bacterial Ig domain